MQQDTNPPEDNIMPQTTPLQTEEASATTDPQAIQAPANMLPPQPPLSFRICAFLLRFKASFAGAVLLSAMGIVLFLVILYFLVNAYSTYIGTGVLSGFSVLVMLVLLMIIFVCSALLAVATIFERYPSKSWVFWPTLIPMLSSSMILSSFILSFVFNLMSQAM